MGGGGSKTKKKETVTQSQPASNQQQPQQQQQPVQQQQQPVYQSQPPPQQQQQPPQYQQQQPPSGQQNMPSYLMPLRQKVTVMNNDVALRKKTLTLVDAKEGGGLKNLTFQYDALKPMEIRVYLGGVENLEFFTNLTMSIANDKWNEYHNIQNCGKALEFKSDQSLDLNKLFGDDQWTTKENYWPLIIRIERFPIQGTQYSERKIIYYYCNILKGSLKLKLVKQKLEYNHEAYEILEIYGIQASGLQTGEECEQEAANINDDQNTDCIICFTDQIDTVIMPCRHMCICMECAKSLQQTKKKAGKQCPVCRKDIESFLRIKREENANK